MKHGILSIAIGTVALMAASAASARVSVSVGVNPYGYGHYYAPPPVYYRDDPYYYAAPPVIYFGTGHWGGGRDRHAWDRGHRSRGHDDRRDHHH